MVGHGFLVFVSALTIGESSFVPSPVGGLSLNCTPNSQHFLSCTRDQATVGLWSFRSPCSDLAETMEGAASSPAWTGCRQRYNLSSGTRLTESVNEAFGKACAYLPQPFAAYTLAELGSPEFSRHLHHSYVRMLLPFLTDEGTEVWSSQKTHPGVM